ncbi:MAG: efflux RND transporter permease subunit [Thermoanaerobaculia bacterium]
MRRGLSALRRVVRPDGGPDGWCPLGRAPGASCRRQKEEARTLPQGSGPRHPAGLLPILWSTQTGSEVAKPIATPVLGGMLSSLVHVLIVTPVIWTMLKEWELRRGKLEVGKASEILKA